MTGSRDAEFASSDGKLAPGFKYKKGLQPAKEITCQRR